VEAGFELRESLCSMWSGMNPDSRQPRSKLRRDEQSQLEGRQGRAVATSGQPPYAASGRDCRSTYGYQKLEVASAGARKKNITQLSAI